MANYIKGDGVANATSYELAEKKETEYTVLATESQIDFDLSKISLTAGSHVLVVRAKADGYEKSDWSNEVTYTVGEDQGDDSGGSETPTLSIDIEEGSLGSDSGNEIAYTNVWRTAEHIDIDELTGALSLTGSVWLIAVFNKNMTYLGQLMTDKSGLIKNSGQWLDSGTTVKVSEITAASSSAKYIRIVMKTDTPKIFVGGVNCFGKLLE